jgi:ABC-2 type transport system permease protein
VDLIRVLAIARRELIALFVSPAGWVVFGLFVLLCSAFGFVLPVLAGQAATMDGVFGVITSLLLPILVPVITMQVFAGKRSDENVEPAAAKWLGAFIFYVLLLAATLPYVVLLAIYVPGHLASLDLGLIASAYLGLLVTGGAATAVGALASSLTQNRIVAFLLALAILLVTWYAGTLLGFLTPPPVSQVFRYAAGSNHYQSFGLGLVTMRDTVYFFSLGIAALFLATRFLATRFLATRRLQSRSAGVLPAALALVLVIALNAVASRSTLSWDLTRSGINTLAPQSIAAAKRLDADLLVIGLFRSAPGDAQAQSEALVALYQAQSPRIVYRSVSFDTDVTDVRKYSVTEPGTLVLDYRGKTQVLTPPLQTEQDFTSALLKLESGRAPVVCWAAGVGGRNRSDTGQNGYSSLADVLTRNNFEMRDLLMAGLTAVPTDCDELVLIAPAVALSTGAVKALVDYMAGGRSLLIADDPWSQTSAATASLNDVLKPYRLGFSGALVVEPDASRAFDVITPATLAYGRSPITRDIQGIASVFPQTTAITGTGTVDAVSVVISGTTNLSYGIATPRQDLPRQAGDIPGPFAIMETLEVPAGQKEARIVMVGTTAFAENKVMPPSSNAANLELALGTFQWLAREDALVSLQLKPPRALPLNLTQQDQGTVLFITILLMPGLVVFGGVIVWRRRRRGR